MCFSKKKENLAILKNLVWHFSQAVLQCCGIGTVIIPRKKKKKKKER